MSGTADWQTCPAPGFMNKDLTWLCRVLEAHFILRCLVFSLLRVIFLSGSQYFAVILFKENDTQGLCYHQPGCCSSSLLSLPLEGSLKPGVGLYKGFCFVKVYSVPSAMQCPSANLNMFFISSWQQQNSTRSESSGQEPPTLRSPQYTK